METTNKVNITNEEVIETLNKTFVEITMNSLKKYNAPLSALSLDAVDVISKLYKDGAVALISENVESDNYSKLKLITSELEYLVTSCAYEYYEKNYNGKEKTTPYALYERYMDLKNNPEVKKDDVTKVVSQAKFANIIADEPDEETHEEPQQYEVVDKVDDKNEAETESDSNHDEEKSGANTDEISESSKESKPEEQVSTDSDNHPEENFVSSDYEIPETSDEPTEEDMQNIQYDNGMDYPNDDIPSNENDNAGDLEDTNNDLDCLYNPIKNSNPFGNIMNTLDSVNKENHPFNESEDESKDSDDDLDNIEFFKNRSY